MLNEKSLRSSLRPPLLKVWCEMRREEENAASEMNV